MIFSKWLEADRKSDGDEEDDNDNDLFGMLKYIKDGQKDKIALKSDKANAKKRLNIKRDNKNMVNYILNDLSRETGYSLKCLLKLKDLIVKMFAIGACIDILDGRYSLFCFVVNCDKFVRDSAIAFEFVLQMELRPRFGMRCRI